MTRAWAILGIVVALVLGVFAVVITRYRVADDGATARPPKLTERRKLQEALPVPHVAPIVADTNEEPLPGAIEGIVISRTGAPAPDVLVNVRPIADDGLSFVERRVTTSDELGQFRLAMLPLEDFVIAASAEANGAVDTVRLTSANPSASVRLILGRGGVIAGIVVDSKGNAVAGARIQGTHQNAQSLSRNDLRHLSTTQSDENGRFRFDFLPETSWRFHVSKRDVAAAFTDSITVGSGNLRIVLQPGSHLRGRLVRLESGEPLPNVSVSVSPSDLPTEHGSVTSDDQGNFQLSGLAEGNYLVSLENEEWAVFQGAQEVAVPVSANARLTIPCVAASAIEGLVLEAGESRPIEGVQVLAYPSFGERAAAALSGPEGRFTIRGLPPVVVRVWIAANAERHFSGNYDLAPGETKQVVLRFPNQVRIGGIVVDETGAPVADATVRYSALGGTRSGGRVRSVADGRFEIAAATPGVSYSLIAETLDRRSDEREIAVPLDGKEEVELVLHPSGGRISGTVVDPLGRPIQARVHALRGDSKFSDWQHDSDSDGTFVIAGLPAANYRIGLGPLDDTNRPFAVVHTLVLAPGQEIGGLRLLYDLTAMPVIGGMVVDPDGNPVAGAYVVADAESGANLSQPTGPDGSFLIAGIKEGVEYALRVQQSDFQRNRAVIATTGMLDVLLVVKPLPLIQGRVVDADGGTPVTRFSIATGSLNRPTTPSTSVENVDGLFSVSAALGANELFVRAEGYRDGRLSFPSVYLGDRLDDRVVALEPIDARLNGRVTDSQGRPLPGACIQAGRQLNLNVNAECLTNSDVLGQFQMRLPSEEPAWITIVHPDCASQTFPVTPSVGRVEEFILETGGRVVVRVQTSGSSVRVALGTPDAGPFYVESVGANGDAVFERVLPGIYDLALLVSSAGEPATVPVEAQCEVQSGLTTELNLGQFELP